jgi:hypothetical protein
MLPFAANNSGAKARALAHATVGEVGDIVGVADIDSTSTVAVSAKAKVHSRAGIGRDVVVGTAAALESIAGFDESRGSEGEAEEEVDGHDSGLGVHVCSLGRH